MAMKCIVSTTLGEDSFMPSFQFLTTYNDMHLESIVFVAEDEKVETNNTNYEHYSSVVRHLTDFHEVPLVFVAADEKLETSY